MSPDDNDPVKDVSDAARDRHQAGSSDATTVARKARQLLDTPGARVCNQHVVSKTIMRQFAEDLGREGDRSAHAGVKVGVWHRVHGQSRPIGPGAAGVVKNFLTVDSAGAERVWAGVETSLPDAIRAARSPTVLRQEHHLDVLRQAVALHFARSLAAREVMSRVWAESAGPLREEIAERHRERLETYFRVRTGRSASVDDVRALVRRFTSDIEELVETGAWARVRTEDFFYRTLSRCRLLATEIVRVPDRTLVISDSPVVLCSGKGREVSSRSQPAWDEATAIVMPLAPDLAISLAQLPAYSEAAWPLVRRLNKWQAANARKYVFHRPSQDVSHLRKPVA